MENMSTATFRETNLSSSLVATLFNKGCLVHPTPVQYHCIPKILEGNDCIIASQTGTGKTLTFALPILDKLNKDPHGFFALVLTPTRELAFQIADQFRQYKNAATKVTVIIGGQDMASQAKELTLSPNILISTPGRLADHLAMSNTNFLQTLKFLVLDEADRMLEGHFTDQLNVIFNALPKERQTLLFSATLTKTLEEVSSIPTTKPFIWSAESEVATVEKLDQKYIISPPVLKDAYLVHVVHQFQERNPANSVIIFTKTCKLCQLLSVALKNLGFTNVALNSMLSQKERLDSLSKFKSSTVKLLIATDVASRGLDIPAVNLVINHNVPSVPKDYVHRVGRTARAGRGGLAVTILTIYDIKRLHAIEELINTKLEDYKINESKVQKIVLQVNVAIREAEITLDEKDFGEKKIIYKRKKNILDGIDPDSEQSSASRKRKRKIIKPKLKV